MSGKKRINFGSHWDWPAMQMVVKFYPFSSSESTRIPAALSRNLQRLVVFIIVTTQKPG
jgi:hypothetical protein